MPLFEILIPEQGFVDMIFPEGVIDILDLYDYQAILQESYLNITDVENMVSQL